MTITKCSYCDNPSCYCTSVLVTVTKCSYCLIVYPVLVASMSCCYWLTVPVVLLYYPLCEGVAPVLPRLLLHVSRGTGVKRSLCPAFVHRSTARLLNDVSIRG